MMVANDDETNKIGNDADQTEIEDTELNEILASPKSNEGAATRESNVTKARENSTEKPSKTEAIAVNVDDMETVTVIMDPISHSKKLKVVTNPGPLSTHVLDTIKGSPAIGLGVTLYKLKDSRWTLITESVTDADGRCNDLLSMETMTAGRYKLQYALSQYYTIRNQDCFYPVVELTIDLADPNQKYNVPLLISPFSYSTYKA